MNLKSSNLYYHISYWAFVMLTLTLVFGLSWDSNMAAFYFISMLLPIVLGTSYFFNYILVPNYYLKNKFIKFGLYSIYTVIVSLYIEMIVLMFSYIYLGNFSFKNLGPNISDTILMAVILYLLVFVGSLLLMVRQIKENKEEIRRLLLEKEKMKIAQLEIISNRKNTKIPYNEILYIESLVDYIQIHTLTGSIASKEKISALADRLPDLFLRIHRSFIINKEKVKTFSYNEVWVGDQQLNIGRSYKKEVKEKLKEN
jgi:hypothetical protein